MSMSLDRRLQVLVDDERYDRLEQESRRRGVSVATIVREALDVALPSTADERRRAGEALLAAEPIDVGDWPELREELAAVSEPSLRG